MTIASNYSVANIYLATKYIILHVISLLAIDPKQNVLTTDKDSDSHHPAFGIM